MSTRAAVYAMKMKIGTRTITAKIEERDKARKDYEKAKSEGKRASLLEQDRPNVFTMNVANIAAGDEITVEMKYTELLIPENGIYSFVYPTVVGPRYSEITENTAAPQDKFIETPYTKAGESARYKFGLNLTINSAVPISHVTCNTHTLKTTGSSPYITKAAIAPATDTGNRDVIINYSLQGEKVESGIMCYNHNDENFFLLMLQPPKKVAAKDIPPREYVFIVDVSGSMYGFPLDTSKKLLKNLISNLRPKEDSFNVILFESNAQLLNETSLPATEENVQKAFSFIDRRNGGGGTRLLDAVKKAYSIPRSNSEVSRSFVILTDGYISAENDVFDFIRENSNNTNFFSFGIGSSVNRYLIEGMAHMGNGEPMIVTNEKDAEQQAEKFRNYIQTPVMTQIKVDYNMFNVYDVEPIAIPDMLAERPIAIFGKYKGTPVGNIRVQGKTGGKDFSQTINLNSIKANENLGALRYLWARERIKQLSYYDNNRYKWQDDKDNFKDKITQLGLKYGLMTNYTSFIAVDDRIVTEKGNVTVRQPSPMPEGVSDYAVMQGVVLDDLEKVVIAAPTAPMREEQAIFKSTEQPPVFPGGQAELMKYLAANLQYPKDLVEAGIEGRVVVQFVVNEDGSISDVKVLQSLHPSADAEAVRLIKGMPRWIPGKQNGKPVRVYYTIPIRFRLTQE